MGDEIRAKRLAKLGGTTPSPAPSPSPSPSAPAQVSSTALPSPPSSSSSAIATPAQQDVVMEPAAQPVTPKKPEVQTPPPKASPVASSPMEVDSKSTKAGAFENWEHDTLQRILRVSLVPTTNRNLLYLEELAQEIKDEGGSHTLTKDLIDRVIIARLSVPKDAKRKDDIEPSHFEYLMGVFERAFEEERRLTKVDVEKRQAILSDAKQFAVSYSGLVIQMPDMFATESGVSGTTILTERLLEDRVRPEFLQALVERFKDDGLDTIFNRVLTSISNNMRQQSFSKAYNPPISALYQLTMLKPIADLARSLPSWCPKNCTAREFELISFLGPFFRPSVFYEDEQTLGDQYFANPTRLTQSDVNGALSALRMTVHNYETQLHQVAKGILTASAESREQMVQFIAEAIVKNEKRGQMQVDRTQVSTDGFVSNLALVCLQLCEPFINPNSKGDKLKVIETDYPLKSSRFHIAKETRLRAQSDEIEAWQKANLTEEARKAYVPKFITECFFLTSHLLHLSLIKGFAKYGYLLKDIREAQKALKRLKEAPPNPQTEVFLERVQQQFDIMIRVKFTSDVLLLDPQLLATGFRFYSFVCDYLMFLADPEKKGFPLSKEVPFAFKILPEFMVEDVADFFVFVARYCPENLRGNDLSSVVAFIVMFLSQPDYIKSPHLRSKLAEILYMLTPEYQDQTGVRTGVEFMFNQGDFILNHLAKGLMDFYQEVENTGSSHQFYEKFNVRYHISVVMKFIWGNSMHRQRIREESNNESFVRFINLLLNDTTFLLDESLTMLGEIHKVQEKMKDEASWNALPENERKEIEQSHQTNEKRCQSLLFLAKETLFMLSYLTKEMPAPFLKPQILDRLVAMLNFNVAQLVGPKCTELKVQDPQKYGFNPKELLSIILEIYVHLYQPTFIEGMVREGRSYQRAHFDKACGILRRFMLKTEDEIQVIEKLVAEVEAGKQKEIDLEQELGEVPDEFMDPITYMMMTDPVLLPTSGTIVDRSTIETHLLSDTIDPFNRKPLSIDMVQPVPELKEKINQFLAKTKKR